MEVGSPHHLPSPDLRSHPSPVPGRRHRHVARGCGACRLIKNAPCSTIGRHHEVDRPTICGRLPSSLLSIPTRSPKSDASSKSVVGYFRQPPYRSHRANPDRSHCLGYRPALRRQHVNLPQLGHDLFGGVPLPCHRHVLRLAQSHTSGTTTSQGTDHFPASAYTSGVSGVLASNGYLAS